MDIIENTIEQIGCFDEKAAMKAEEHLSSLAMPPWALGDLMDLAKILSGITGNIHPICKRKTCVVMCADHGVSEEGVSAYPKDITALMVPTILKKGAGINAVANSVNCQVVVADVGIDADFSDCKNDNFINKKISRGTANFTKGPAMTLEQAAAAVKSGIEIANDLSLHNDIFGIGEVGISNTTSAASILCAITGIPAEEVAGTGSGIDHSKLKHKIDIIKKALNVNNPNSKNGMDILHKVGGYEIGAIAGFILGAAAERKPVIIDGFISTSAALLAQIMCPNSIDFVIASHMSVETGHKIMLKKLNKKAYLDLKLRLGEGTGAAMMMPLVDSACSIINNMFTLEQVMTECSDY